ncbi:MAG: Rrf2 family transcriptional regulator [Campylobacteraceae bacterium]|nr:Rrf2 family transcriptional regulator [Campylobacteraceae bacterium]
MLFTKASEYALLSLIYIARKDVPQDVDTISRELDISKSFLAKILQNLAKEEILYSFKGANGGFKLAKDACEINLKEIIEGAEKQGATVFVCSNAKEDCEKSDICGIWHIFNTLQQEVDGYLEKITLEDIMNKKGLK